jgi:L-ascorbate metabolism protein UlaG (beta-lactamase superfamily)
MARSIALVSRTLILLAGVLLASLVAAGGATAQAQEATPTGKVKLEWLGHEFYRLTSPQGTVVVTSPWLANPSGPVALEELTRTDVILVPNAHGDDMGNPIEVSNVSGSTVLAPGPLGRWLIDNGLDQTRFRRVGVGDLFALKNVQFKIGPSAHDNTLPNGTDGGPAVSFFVKFENGFTVFFNGHSTLLGDLPIYASIYQPDLAILGLTEAVEFANTAKLMATNNPKLRTIIPSHIRPGAPILNEARQELERLGLSQLMVMPDLRTVYEY